MVRNPEIRAMRATSYFLVAILLATGPDRALAYTREHRPDRFLGVIVEGPHDWPVRPVAELFSDLTSGGPRVHSRLAGAIWRVRERLNLDFAVRSANSAGEVLRERRLGLTWSFPFRSQ
jgi:hypothetical protein